MKCLRALAACVSFLAASVSFAAPVATLSFSAAPAVVGSPVVVDINISDVTDLYAFQFSLAFNPLVLQANSLTEGPFLASSGTTFFDDGTIDNTNGTISFVFDAIISAVPGVTGSGVIGHVTFDVLAAGQSALTLSDVVFLNSAFLDVEVSQAPFTLTATAATDVPEPGSLALLGLGLAGLAAIRRRKQA